MPIFIDHGAPPLFPALQRALATVDVRMRLVRGVCKNCSGRAALLKVDGDQEMEIGYDR